MVTIAGLSFLQVVVLARILTPSDFGLMAMVTVVIAFSQIFADMGVSSAIVHYQEISHEELSSLYWLNVLFGLGLMLLLILISPLVAAFYNEPGTKPILTWLSATFLVGALGQQLRVMAQKTLRFAELIRLELAAASAGFTMAIAVAIAGGGVYAMVAGTLTGSVVSTVLAWLFLSKGWRPMRRLRLGEIRHFLGFGAYMIGNNIANTFNSQMDILLGGRMLGAGTLGLYSLPRELSLRIESLVNPIVTRVGFPLMAKVQEDKPFLKSIYLKTLRMTASVNFPIYLGASVFAPDVVVLVFGSQWQAATPLLRVLALWGLMRSTISPVGGLILSVGRADLSFKWNAVMLLIMPPVVLLGAQYESIGLAMALLSGQTVVVVLAWWFLVRRLCGAGFMEYYSQMLVPLILAIIAVAAGFLAAWPFTGAASRLIAGFVAGSVVYLLSSRFLNTLWYDAIWELMVGEKR